MTRRQLLALTCFWTSARATGTGQHAPQSVRPNVSPDAPIAGDADITLRIGELALELAPGRVVRTLAYNGQVPGPLLRAPRGKPVSVDVVNQSKQDDIVHWHGFHIPSNVDGAYEEGTPGVPPNSTRRYTFTPDPAGTRWYHSHTMAARDFKKGTYTGQFGMFIVEDEHDAGAYDLEVPLILHEWEARLTREGPTDVEYKYFSINGKSLGGGEPIRVRPSQRVLFRILNASATMDHRLALPGHLFNVVALDGNPVASPARVPSVFVAPGERVDAIVEMNTPGIWMLGEVRNDRRAAGMGVVIEYAGSQGPARWLPPQNSPWDYRVFGQRTEAPEPTKRHTLVFRAKDDGHHWTINGKSFPKTDPIIVGANERHRLILDNQSANDHPIHLHRHRFELTRFDNQPMSGVWKDVVVVPAWKQVEVDVPTTQPGLSLFHCHQQFHMDMGFMAMMQYS